MHMRTGWWMPFVFCIDGNHDVIQMYLSNIIGGVNLLERERESARERERGGWHDHVPNDSLTYISFQ